MLDPIPTRQELRVILTNPNSTREQVLQATLILVRRIANGPDKVTQICTQYGLSPEQSAALIAGHQSRVGELIDWAKEEVQRLERLLKQTEPEQPAT